MPNVDRAAERIANAMRHGEQIVIYGDYDVDGLTASAILLRILRAIHPDAPVTHYLPDRVKEGYGLHAGAVRRLAKEGAQLIVTVDSGVTARKAALAAKDAGVDLIITDHHNLPPEDKLPDALLVHPRLPGSAYPYGELCGAGVAFKLAWRIATCWCEAERVDEHLKDVLLQLLPLAALGTVADVVPLTGENRTITAFGLRLLPQTQLTGLRTMLELCNLADGAVESEHVAFQIAPRINAAGRLDHAGQALVLLTSEDRRACEAIAKDLDKLNRQRQETERSIFRHAMEMAVERAMTGDDHRAIVLADHSWHPGVIGIVCSRLVERFGRPTILLAEKNGTCKGSGRSIDGFSLHDGLTAVKDHLESFGGHAMAAGLALATENVPAFTEAFVEHCNARITPDGMIPSIDVDCDASLLELDHAAVSRLETLAPFGRDNRRPAIRVREAVLDAHPRTMGQKNRHLAVQLRQEHDGRRRVIRGVWWKQGEIAEKLAPGMPIDAIVEPKLNHWNGRTSVEVEIRDILIHGT